MPRPVPLRCAARRSTHRTAGTRPREAGLLQAVDELLGAREPLHRRGQVRVRGASRQHLAEQRDDAVEPERVEGPGEAARLGDLEDRDPAARLQHAAELAEREVEVGDVADAEADGCRVEGLVGEREREQVALHPVERRLAARAGEHALREVEPGDPVRARLEIGDREVAGAAGRVEHTVAGAHDRLGGVPAPADVEPGRHHAVHQVVDRRDAVEHRAHGVGRQRHGCPQRATSEFASPSWSRIRPTTKSTRSSMVDAPW